jgi:hypothetical protein
MLLITKVRLQKSTDLPQRSSQNVQTKYNYENFSISSKGFMMF